MPIETLAGAQNLSEIADIEYIQKKLLTALRVPKSFLGFEETVGDGKNLSLQDIRFARTINKIQKSMVAELNKIAIIHLYILGLEDELENFTLTLNNPSTQAEMLKVEQTQLRVTLYKDAVSDAGNGFGAMSMTRAKKDILGMSEEEIRNDLEQQRLEKAAAAEMEQTAEVIKKTGIFDRVDRLYGDFDALVAGAGGGEAGGDAADAGDDAGGAAPEMDAGAAPEADAGAAAPTEESIKKKENLLLEINEKKYNEKIKKYQGMYLRKLTESLDKNENIYNLDKFEDGADILNSKISEITKQIDSMID
jgi:hypothetical protein